MIEALRIPSPQPRIIEDYVETPGIEKNYVNIPPNLIRASDRNGTERAVFTELRVKNLIASQSDIVENVIRHEMGSDEDMHGYDLTVILKKTQPVRIVRVQVKARRQEVQEYKQYLKGKYFPNVKNSDQLLTEWLAINRIILINGAETKAGREIIEESFIPQLERIFQRSGAEMKKEKSAQMVLFPEPELEQIQIFPET